MLIWGSYKLIQGNGGIQLLDPAFCRLCSRISRLGEYSQYILILIVYDRYPLTTSYSVTQSLSHSVTVSQSLSHCILVTQSFSHCILVTQSLCCGHPKTSGQAKAFSLLVFCLDQETLPSFFLWRVHKNVFQGLLGGFWFFQNFPR